jgi:hypothetical protein
LTSAKRQAQAAFDKASKVSSLMKQVSILDNEVSSLTAKILHHEECNSFLLGIVESACEMLRCEYLFFDSFFPYLRTAFFVISLLLQVLVWILLLKNVESLSVMLLWRGCQLAARICGPILDAGAPLCCFWTVPSILVSLLTVADEPL